MNIIFCTYSSHAAPILDILNDAIINSTALYDYSPRTMDNMTNWFKLKQEHNFPIIGVESSTGELMGFATYGFFRPFPANKYTVEHSVYIHPNHRKKGLGNILMNELIPLAKQQDYHTMIGAIDVTNKGSIVLHEKLGFCHAGTMKEVAFKFNRWLDLGFYQLLLSTPNTPDSNVS